MDPKEKEHIHDTVKNVLEDIGQFTDEELRAINDAVIRQLKFNRSSRADAARRTFKAGDRVKFNGRAGATEGTIVRVKRKKAIVSVDEGRLPGNWDVPLGMLSAA